MIGALTVLFPSRCLKLSETYKEYVFEIFWKCCRFIILNLKSLLDSDYFREMLLFYNYHTCWKLYRKRWYERRYVNILSSDRQNLSYSINVLGAFPHASEMFIKNDAKNAIDGNKDMCIFHTHNSYRLKVIGVTHLPSKTLLMRSWLFLISCPESKLD